MITWEIMTGWRSKSDLVLVISYRVATTTPNTLSFCIPYQLPSPTTLSILVLKPQSIVNISLLYGLTVHFISITEIEKTQGGWAMENWAPNHSESGDVNQVNFLPAARKDSSLIPISQSFLLSSSFCFFIIHWFSDPQIHPTSLSLHPCIGKN